MLDKALLSVADASFEFPCIETTVERVNASAARFELLDEMIVERGTRADWELLHDLHYKAEKLPIGPRFWKCSLHGQTIGVLVTGNAKGLLKERHMIFPKAKPCGADTKISNTQRYVWVNANFRVVSRFVFDTMYRGIGCGYRMMNLVARMEGNTYMEIQSSMSKFNHFGQKAGFRFLKPINARKFEIGLRFFRQHFESTPQDYEAIVNELNSKAEVERNRILEECRAFYYRHSALERTGAARLRGENRVLSMGAPELIKALQQVCLASPMYGIYISPDKGRVIPQSLPLTAFDWQKATEPFNAQH
jgi:hypothetical protein